MRSGTLGSWGQANWGLHIHLLTSIKIWGLGGKLLQQRCFSEAGVHLRTRWGGGGGNFCLSTQVQNTYFERCLESCLNLFRAVWGGARRQRGPCGVALPLELRTHGPICFHRAALSAKLGYRRETVVVFLEMSAWWCGVMTVTVTVTVVSEKIWRLRMSYYILQYDILLYVIICCTQ